MGLFDFIKDVVELPLSVAADVIKTPGKIVEGEEGIGEHTADKLKKILEDMSD